MNRRRATRERAVVERPTAGSWRAILSRGLALAALVLAAPLAAVLPWSPAFAQAGPAARPELSATIDRDLAAVGEPFAVQLTVMADGSGPQPQDPALALPAGLAASQPSVSSQTQVSFVNGRFSRRTGITATWSVRAAHEGAYTIPGPTVSWNGQRLRANALRITVRSGPPAGSPRGLPGSRGPQVFGLNPFDPFGMMPGFPGIFDDSQPALPAPAAPVDPELSLAQAPDPQLFLRAVTDKKSAVVGEQVTLTIYLYSRFTQIEASDTHEPTLADFLQRDLTDSNAQPEMKMVSIGGVPWHVEQLRRKALFPLTTGDLPIGPMRMTFQGLRIFGPHGVERSSDALSVHVVEPPAAGRPAGYALGTVGQFQMAASVEPRTTEVGGAVAITVTVTGVGNPPGALAVPANSSVEWLEPQVRDSIEPDAAGQIRGSKTFSYVVRPKAAGRVDLGSIALPYWDPVRRAYATARADLGSIQVAPGAMAAGGSAAGPTDADPFAGIGAPRTRLDPVPPQPAPLTDRRWYWLGLFGAPLLVLAAALISRAGAAAYRRIDARRARPTLAIDQALADARRAEQAGDARAAAACLERAVHAAIEASTALRARALLLDEVAPALVARGLEPTLAGGARDLLGQLESLRFSPAAGAALPGLIPQAESIVRSLRRVTTRRRS